MELPSVQNHWDSCNTPTLCGYHWDPAKSVRTHGDFTKVIRLCEPYSHITSGTSFYSPRLNDFIAYRFQCARIVLEQGRMTTYHFLCSRTMQREADPSR